MTYAELVAANARIADACEIDYDDNLDWFYGDDGRKLSKFQVGQEAYYAAMWRTALTCDEMRRGFDAAHTFANVVVAKPVIVWNYSDEPGYRASWHTY
jgi:hypothetical protein